MIAIAIISYTVSILVFTSPLWAPMLSKVMAPETYIKFSPNTEENMGVYLAAMLFGATMLLTVAMVHGLYYEAHHS